MASGRMTLTTGRCRPNGGAFWPCHDTLSIHPVPPSVGPELHPSVQLDAWESLRLFRWSVGPNKVWELEKRRCPEQVYEGSWFRGQPVAPFVSRLGAFGLGYRL